ncbi:MAG: putative cytochrome c biosis protein ResC [Actinomycetota bacterium]|jgi:cytochrome c-type biogenesis protein CcsB
MTSASLAEWSNLAVYSSMLVLVAALIAFAVSFAARGRRVMTPELVTAGGGAPERPGPSDDDAVVPDGPGRRAGNIAMALTWLATGLLLVGLVLRGLWAGRVPWGNMYEFSLTWTFGILAVFLVVSLRRDIRWLGLPVIFLSILSLGLAVTVLYTEAAQLVPALRSWWLIIHVAAAVICGGAFSVAAAISALYLWRERAERKGHVTGIVAALPDASRLDTLAYRILAFAFPLWTFAVISGAIWAEYAWGRYWGWDPKETWAFITWVIYAGYLHARSTAGWRGRRAAYISLLGFVSFLINYFGVNIFVNSLHSYAGL